MPEFKEAGYLAKDDYDQHKLEYAILFSGLTSESVLGEGSTWYTNVEFEETSRQNILKHFPDIKLIFVARDPIARIESSYREYHHSGPRFGLDCPFNLDQALRQYPNIINDTLYWSRIQNYRPYFPEEQILVLFMEDLASDPDCELSRCFEFLGVDPSIRIPNTVRRLNPGSTKFFDTERLRQMRHDPDTGPTLSKIPPDIQDQFLVGLGLRKKFSGGPLPWDDSTLKWVLEKIEDDIRNFLQTYGKPVNFWPRFAETCAGSMAVPTP